MKSLAIASALLVAGFVGSAKAGEISKSTLSSMGFSSVTVMSDIDGLAIRGKGTSASVWGEGTANYTNRAGSNTSTNGYNAAADHHRGSSTANGSNLSYAGNLHNHSLSVNFAGGTSAAFAK